MSEICIFKSNMAQSNRSSSQSSQTNKQIRRSGEISRRSKEAAKPAPSKYCSTLRCINPWGRDADSARVYETWVAPTISAKTGMGWFTI